MIETETENASATAVRVREIMEHAGRHVLGPGTILRANVEIISHPDRWLDRGRDGGEVGEMWDRIYGALQEIAQGSTFVFPSLENAHHPTPEATPLDTPS